MTSSTDRSQSKQKVFPATVARIISSTRIVINRGSEHGIKKGQQMLVYSLEENEIKDPNTGESLGRLEIYKGTGRIIHVQEKISILESDRNRYIEDFTKTSSSPLFHPLPQKMTLDENIPFEDPTVGDLVKPI